MYAQYVCKNMVISRTIHVNVRQAHVLGKKFFISKQELNPRTAVLMIV